MTNFKYDLGVELRGLDKLDLGSGSDTGTFEIKTGTENKLILRPNDTLESNIKYHITNVIVEQINSNNYTNGLEGDYNIVYGCKIDNHATNVVLTKLYLDAPVSQIILREADVESSNVPSLINDFQAWKNYPSTNDSYEAYTLVFDPNLASAGPAAIFSSMDYTFFTS